MRCIRDFKLMFLWKKIIEFYEANSVHLFVRFSDNLVQSFLEKWHKFYVKTPFPHRQCWGLCQCSQTTQSRHCIKGGGKLALKNDFSETFLQLIVDGFLKFMNQFRYLLRRNIIYLFVNACLDRIRWAMFNLWDMFFHAVKYLTRFGVKTSNVFVFIRLILPVFFFLYQECLQNWKSMKITEK